MIIYLRPILALLPPVATLITAAAFAQPPGPPPPPEHGAIMMHHQVAGPGGAGDFGFADAKILGAGMGLDGKVVKGAPYAAQAVTETAQVLADGTHISRKTSSSVARDAEGRTRREETLSSVGPWSTEGQAHTMVFINDPVSQTNYVLDSAQRSAQKMGARAAGTRRSSAPADAPPGLEAKRNAEAKANVMRDSHRREQQANTKTESLGTQTIAGVTVTGTRRTRSIPAGQIGNDRAIDIVSETWYSPDLQMVIMSKHNDPRFGETTYTLTNLQRSEPDATLFTVPADYSVQENSKNMMFRRLEQ